MKAKQDSKKEKDSKQEKKKEQKKSKAKENEEEEDDDEEDEKKETNKPFFFFIYCKVKVQSKFFIFCLRQKIKNFCFVLNIFYDFIIEVKDHIVDFSSDSDSSQEAL